jgi:hypothetical protein
VVGASFVDDERVYRSRVWGGIEIGKWARDTSLKLRLPWWPYIGGAQGSYTAINRYLVSPENIEPLPPLHNRQRLVGRRSTRRYLSRRPSAAGDAGSAGLARTFGWLAMLIELQAKLGWIERKQETKRRQKARSKRNGSVRLGEYLVRSTSKKG